MEVWLISHTAKEEFVLSVLTICHTEYMYEIHEKQISKKEIKINT